MPELPEVVTVANELHKQICNKKINKFWVKNSKFIKEITPNDFAKEIENSIVTKVTNKAKHILIFLDNNKVIISHLRMSGKYFSNQNHIGRQHDYVFFEFSDKSVLIYNDARQFGTFHLRNIENLFTTKPLINVANEPFDINFDDFYLKLSKIKRVIKTALLDQSLISGLGNIYVDEVLFASKVAPWEVSSSISKNKALEILKNSQRILKESIKLGGSSINSYTSLDAKEGSFQNFLQVHTKKDKPCPNCQKLIEKITINGRGTYFCRKCQNEK
ncbi:DNA-formamidopyrimidine glycosylase [Mesomycoplasma bovoculi]|uniref:Formamidopyrimidine/5-formyluracil/ 5-hydroxymethyluracil DNA glycosylase n=1 Tax=Mesomycoplasma bovoculi M165/69 TaxID=743966 RepID=W5US66_9BACT|nr:DNA-formamidopyrimidine glycosylase [Mesomycoplasma bovoculi]AHH45069.1 formamidopyrimidine/5-formyluracil/ 5-hydroxymethyluracil DNA glycosylase [Mesomycoplasma bovoculi M165/69]